MKTEGLIFDTWSSLLKPVDQYINHPWQHTTTSTPYSVFFGRMIDHLSCEVQSNQCKGFLEKDFLVQINDDTEDDSSTLDLSELQAKSKCNHTNMCMFLIDSTFAERYGEHHEQLHIITKEIFEETEKCIF